MLSKITTPPIAKILWIIILPWKEVVMKPVVSHFWKYE